MKRIVLLVCVPVVLIAWFVRSVGASVRPSGELGPAADAELASFVGEHLTGSHAGRRACPLCVHGTKPAVLLIARPRGLESAVATARALERVLAGEPEWQATGCVVYVPGSGESDAAARRRLQSALAGAGLARVFALFVDEASDRSDLAAYRLPHDDDPRTLAIAHVNRRAAATFVDLGGGAAAESRLRAALESLFVREAPYRERAVALCGEDEPGRKLEFWGRVFDEQGLPLAKASVLAYQTDASGHYAPPGSRTRSPRLCDVAVTDAGGWFRFTSVEPGPYPGRDEPAHVHFTITAAFHDLRWVTVWFSDDPLVTPAKRRALDSETVIVDAPIQDGVRSFRIDVHLEGS
ncbi:MAG: hypothetical protein L6Q99_13120 [Planctomycetes bacterium]|nr:hypothetical protein [Planctomycetota bacterium]